jgi:hypothetical protein
MRVTLTAHDAAADGDEESRQFHFLVDDDGNRRTASVTLRTARILVRELANRTALDALLRSIVGTEPNKYDSLVGKRFADR